MFHKTNVLELEIKEILFTNAIQFSTFASIDIGECYSLFYLKIVLYNSSKFDLKLLNISDENFES